jgi:hypothetical protein
METTTKTTTTTKKRTITLTGRPPVRIDEAVWPIIARATRATGGNGNECDATRGAEIRVRENGGDAPGTRTIVYGHTWSRWQGASGSSAGELLESTDPAAVCAAIRRVCEEMGASEDLAQACIADLPAEEV